MKNFIKLNISEIPIENAHGNSGKRQVLVKPEDISSPYLEAVTKAFLNPGNCFEWHNHNKTDEIFIVLKGEGKYFCEEKITSYKTGDVLITPANLRHKIQAQGKETSEYYFIRIKG